MKTPEKPHLNQGMKYNATGLVINWCHLSPNQVDCEDGAGLSF